MFTDIQRFLTLVPAVSIVLLVPVAVLVALAWFRRIVLVNQGRVFRGNAVVVFGLLFGVLLAGGLVVLLSRASAGPTAAYVSEHGGDRRITSITSRSGRSGSFCDVQTWRLSDGRFIGADTRRGQCMLSPDAAFTRLERVDLWAGGIGPSIGELLEASHREGARPLPGSGDWKVVERTAAGVSVRLQDDVVRYFEWSNGVPATRLVPSREIFEHPELGVFSARVLPADCGCSVLSCGTLISFLDVAFGDGRLFVGLLEPGADGQPQLVWSQPATALFGSTGTIFGALPDGDQCIVVGGRSGGRLAAARVERQTGAFESLWGS